MSRRSTFEMLLARASVTPPAGSDLSGASPLHRCYQLTASATQSCLAWLQASRARVLRARASRRLRVVENVSLGDRRFVALIRVDDREYLVGTGATGVALLTELPQRCAPPSKGGDV